MALVRYFMVYKCTVLILNSVYVVSCQTYKLLEELLGVVQFVTVEEPLMVL